jgi:hypothetical protein
MRTTAYFERRRHDHGIEYRHVEEALDGEVHRETQPDGRIRVWGFVRDFGMYVRVILLADGETVHNAFRDRRFRPPATP